MAYAASALSFMLENLAKTVVFTGSQIPFANVYNDARRNLIVSMIVAASSEFPEVCVCFNTKILRANRTVKMDSSGLDAFDSPNFPPLAQLAGKVLYNRDLVLLPPRGRFYACKTLESHVIVVKLVPGFDDEAIMALVQHSSSLRAIVLELYGTGNAPSRKTALVSALRTARERDIVVVGLSQCLRGGMSLSTYTMGKELARAGVISGGDMTTEACTTKLAYLCALLPDPRQVEHYVALNLRGELGSAVDHDSNSRPLRQAVIPQGLSKL
jgi:L-asparaginase